MPRYDVVVVGSGLSGAHAALPLVERGLHVCMLDVGIQGEKEPEDHRSFEEIRRSDPRQHETFLGNDFSSIDFGGGHARSMVSGARAYIVEGSEYAPLQTGEAQVLQSFARGGLSEAWSGVSDVFDESELKAVGLTENEMRAHYKDVMSIIGVSGSLAGWPLQPPPKLDDAAKSLLTRYEHKRSSFRAHGFELRQPLYSMLTQRKDEREAQPYRDMDFWNNAGNTLYRARHTIDVLKDRDNFSYIPQMLVLALRDTGNGVVVSVRDLAMGTLTEYYARAAILAAGAVNSTRIMLRSSGAYETPVPFIMKNHYIVPFLFPSRLGKRNNPKRHSFAQLALHAESRTSGMRDVYAQLLTYNSLLLSKLLRYIPLPVPEALSALAILAPALVLADIRFPSVMDESHTISLKKRGEFDVIDIKYSDSEGVRREQDRTVSAVRSMLRVLGLYALTQVRNAYGTTSQYAGGIPFDGEGVLSALPTGQVKGLEHIFVADSATWRALPAKPPGLTLMANARRVGFAANDFLSRNGIDK